MGARCTRKTANGYDTADGPDDMRIALIAEVGAAFRLGRVAWHVLTLRAGIDFSLFAVFILNQFYELFIIEKQFCAPKHHTTAIPRSGTLHCSSRHTLRNNRWYFKKSLPLPALVTSERLDSADGVILIAELEAEIDPLGRFYEKRIA